MKYYIIVASKDHVQIGMEEGSTQAGYKKNLWKKLHKDDWVIYYSSKDKEVKAYQKSTAIKGWPQWPVRRCGTINIRTLCPAKIEYSFDKQRFTLSTDD